MFWYILKLLVLLPLIAARDDHEALVGGPLTLELSSRLRPRARRLCCHCSQYCCQCLGYFTRCCSTRCCC